VVGDLSWSAESAGRIEATLESGAIWAESLREIFTCMGSTHRDRGGKIATFVLGQVADLTVELEDADLSREMVLNSRDGWVLNLDTLVLGRVHDSWRRSRGSRTSCLREAGTIQWLSRLQVPEAVAGPVC
jgi:hypothetical protein